MVIALSPVSRPFVFFGDVCQMPWWPNLFLHCGLAESLSQALLPFFARPAFAMGAAPHKELPRLDGIVSVKRTREGK